MSLNHWFNRISVIINSAYSCCNRRIKAILIAVMTFFFTTATNAQFDNQAAINAKESEAKQYVRAMNKRQQAHYSEAGDFIDSIPKLEIDMKTQTANYNYSIGTENKAVFNYATSRVYNLKSFVGGVFLVGNTIQTMQLISILCVANVAGKAKPANPTNKNGVLACGANTMEPRNSPLESNTNAKNSVSSMNRAQQLYYLENESFTDSLDKLGIAGIRAQTPDYNYSIRLNNTSTSVSVFNYAIAREPGLKSYVGGVFLLVSIEKGVFIERILCVANVAGTTQPTNPTNKKGVLACGPDTTKINP